MSFLNYVKDKRFFITFFVMIMIFVSFIILFSDQHSAWAMIIYTNISCFLFAGFYLVSGYLYRRKFYHELSELVHSGQEELPALIPEPQNVQ